MVGLVALATLATACTREQGGADTPSQTVVVCPAGSVFQPGQRQCTAIAGAGGVKQQGDGDPAGGVLATGDASSGAMGARTDAGIATLGSGSSAVGSGTVGSGTVGVVHAAPLRPPSVGHVAVDVSCAFPQGWVALLPAGKYPKDDQFLMQALIGLTDDPSFWGGLAEYRSLHPYAARRCTPSPVRFDVAPGDYFVLAGEAGTFSARGTYDKNGVRRKITVRASTQVRLGPRDLTHTWLCISCPWVVFSDGDGGDLAPFVVLPWRAGWARRGADTHRVARVPVRGGRVRLRVMEREREVTHLDSLVLRVGGRVLLPVRGGARSALARADGVGVEMRRGRQVAVEYEVLGVTDGEVDVTVEAAGYYDPVP